MNDLAIRIEGLSKRYRIGAREPYKTLRDVLTRAVTAPFRRLNQPSKLEIQNPESDEFIWALKDISFEIKRGEVVGVIGRNGAGKSTLLKILSRVTEPTEGWAQVHGRIGSLLEVGTGFHPELTGRDNIYLNGAILGMKRAEIARKFDEIMAFAEVEAFIDTPVKRYSSGMYLRLAFSVAAHLQPAILLVDEALAVGDIEFQKKCIGKMEKVAGEGRTVMVVSHSMNTVKALCSKAILLEQGGIMSMGPVDSVINQYLSSKQVSATEKTVSDQDHDEGGGKSMRVRQIKLLDGPLKSFSVYWRQPISISLEVEVFKSIKDVSFGSAIRMLDDSFVFVVYNDDEGHPQWTFDPGRYTIEFSMQNDLRPGLYKLHIGAYQQYSKLKNLFALDAVLIEVLNFAMDGLVPSPANPGLVCGVKSTFSYRKKNSA